VCTVTSFSESMSSPTTQFNYPFNYSGPFTTTSTITSTINQSNSLYTLTEEKTTTELPRFYRYLCSYNIFPFNGCFKEGERSFCHCLEDLCNEPKLHGQTNYSWGSGGNLTAIEGELDLTNPTQNSDCKKKTLSHILIILTFFFHLINSNLFFHKKMFHFFVT